jgi:hypothetical protein
VLYGNRELANWLKSNFVLHWKSTRPVPKITIDFGDGRVLERTITGNAFHYVLDSRGRFADAIPGLMGAEPFKAGVNKARLFAARSASLSDTAYREARTQWHERQYENNLVRWSNDLGETPGAAARPNPGNPPAARAIERARGKDSIEGTVVRKITPNAESAVRRARGKGLVEAPILDAIARAELEKARKAEIQAAAEMTYAALLARTEAVGWDTLSARYLEGVRLTPSSRKIVERHNPDLALKAIALAGSKRRVEDPMARMIRTFESSLAVDTVRNEYEFHTLIHDRARSGALDIALEDITEWIYAEIFLTPSDDPWLGLAPEDAYTGIADAGLQSR